MEAPVLYRFECFFAFRGRNDFSRFMVLLKSGVFIQAVTELKMSIQSAESNNQTNRLLFMVGTRYVQRSTG